MPLNYARGCQELERLIPSILIIRLLLLQVEITKLQLSEYIFFTYSLYIITYDYLFKWYRYDYFYHIIISICCFINYFKLKNCNFHLFFFFQLFFLCFRQFGNSNSIIKIHEAETACYDRFRNKSQHFWLDFFRGKSTINCEQIFKRGVGAGWNSVQNISPLFLWKCRGVFAQYGGNHD